MYLDKKKQKLRNDKEMEYCVLCKKLTNIEKKTPIGERKYYVETSGQLCADCYAEVYMLIHNENVLEL